MSKPQEEATEWKASYAWKRLMIMARGNEQTFATLIGYWIAGCRSVGGEPREVARLMAIQFSGHVAMKERRERRQARHPIIWDPVS